MMPSWLIKVPSCKCQAILQGMWYIGKMKYGLGFLFLMSAACTGEKQSEELPKSLEELNFQILRDFEGDGLEAPVIELLALAGEEAALNEGMSIPGPDITQLGDMDFSDNADPEKLVGAALSTVVDGNLDAYAAVVPETDQRWNDPDTYPKWTRTLIEGNEADFLAGGWLRTENDIIKKAVVEVPYPQREDYRWLDLEGSPALVSRGWLYKEGEGGAGTTAIAAFQVEILVAEGDGIRWFMSSWTQVESIITDEDFIRKELLKGLWACVENTEVYVNE